MATNVSSPLQEGDYYTPSTGGLLGQAEMYLARGSSPEDNQHVANIPQPRTPTKASRTKAKKERIKEEEEDDDEYVDEATPPPSSSRGNKRRRGNTSAPGSARSAARMKIEPNDDNEEITSPVKPKNTPSKRGPKGPAKALGRGEIELLFDRLSAKLPTQEWTAIVTEMNQLFGTNRRPDNVRSHWNAVTRKKLLGTYGDGS